MYKRFIRYLYSKYIFMPELEAVGVGKRADYLLSHGFDLLPDELLCNLMDGFEVAFPANRAVSPNLEVIPPSNEALIQQAMYLRRFNALH